jgi:hypothetical protein
MKYRFVRKRESYQDYASGRVLLGMPGNPAFPVRLASEVFQRCAAIHRAERRTGPFAVYDPCCGAAYHLTVMGYLHPAEVRRIIGSDIDAGALALAERNLAILSLAGLERRMAELAGMRDAFGKRSHTDALASAARLRERLLARPKGLRLETRLFTADATDQAALKRGLDGEAADIVFTDVPYGWHSEWRSETPPPLPADAGSVWLMLESLRGVLVPQTVVAVAADKAQTIAHEGYERLQRLRAGRRQIAILRPLDHDVRAARARNGTTSL